MGRIAMTEKVQASNMIDIYTDLLRIDKAQGEEKDKEVKNQLRKAKAKLEALGVVTEDLRIE
ncbi:MAG: hypothetical protein IJ641_00325 [Lachnospiraceae bacterium]|nr:hypothetical protein [Lachnospiraceae bacterium]